MTHSKFKTPQYLLAATCIACFSTASLAESPAGLTTESEVRAEVADSMELIASYVEQERDAALERARTSLSQIDAVIEAREQELRENWAEMSDEARSAARSQMQGLRAARNVLGEKYGTLEAGSTEAWDELSGGFVDAWGSFSDAWDEATSGDDATSG